MATHSGPSCYPYRSMYLRKAVPFRSIPLGLRFMVVSAFLFSVMTLFVKVAGQRLPSQEIVLARSVVTLGFSYALVKWRGLSPWGHSRFWLVVRGLCGFSALSCLYYAVTRLPLADATVIQYTNPVFTAIFAAIFLGERMRPIEIASTVLGLLGVAVIARPSFLFGESAAPLDLQAVGIALLGAVLSAAAYVSVRKLRHTEHSLVIVFYFPLVATLCSIPGSAASLVWPTPLEWLVLIAGVGLTAQFGQIYLTRGLYLERAGRAMTASYLQILFAALWGVLFLGEFPSVATFIGAGLVVAGVLLTSKGQAEEVETVTDVEVPPR